MTKETREIIAVIIHLIEQKTSFMFWIFIRFLSAIFPLISIYLFSIVIKELENEVSIDKIIYTTILILFVYIVENFTRVISVQKLAIVISDTEFAIHRFLLASVNTDDKFLRHKAVQSVCNFGDAVKSTLELFRQPGIDSFVSLLAIPSILFFIDFNVFIAVVAYIFTHYFIDLYTTQKYVKLRDLQNSKTENYFAKIQESSDSIEEEKQYERQYKKLANWGFIESFILNSIASIFYVAILLYLFIATSKNSMEISNIVLITGYVVSIQSGLFRLTQIKDRLADTKVALVRLTRKSTKVNIDLNDLLMR